MTSTGAAPYPRLVGDIGGTGCRFGWVAGPGDDVEDVVAEEAALAPEAALARYLERHAAAPPRAAALGVAAPVVGDSVRMTNRGWSFSIRALQERLAVDRLLVLNDFAALAHGLPLLAPGDVETIGGGRAAQGAALALLGPGTGLGVSGLVPAPGGRAVVAGEGGHVSLAPANAREDGVVQALRSRFGHVSAERVLSGDGLVHLHDALRVLDGLPPRERTPAQITGPEGEGDASCAEAVALFFAFLGAVAGDLALTLGARGGVFIGGGIVARLRGRIGGSQFRERFEAKGRYRGYLQAIPTALIVDSSGLALRGADAALGSPAG
jgi:glucokinase